MSPRPRQLRSVSLAELTLGHDAPITVQANDAVSDGDEPLQMYRDDGSASIGSTLYSARLDGSIGSAQQKAEHHPRTVTCEKTMPPMSPPTLPTRFTSRHERGAGSIRGALLAGFAVVFALWLLWGYQLVRKIGRAHV